MAARLHSGSFFGVGADRTLKGFRNMPNRNTKSHRCFCTALQEIFCQQLLMSESEKYTEMEPWRLAGIDLRHFANCLLT